MRRLLRSSIAASLIGLGAGLTVVATTAPGANAADSEAQSQTHTLTRDFFDGAGNPVSVTNDVTVNIDRHTDIQSNERIHVEWSGAHPTGGRSISPYGSGGMNQEYPVLIMECRGNADTVTPQTCWTSTYTERTQSTSADPRVDAAVWLDDKYDSAADAQQISGLTGDQASKIPAGDCQFDSTLAAHITPFQAASGQVYYACSDQDMPPEASENSVTPPNEVSAFTNANGSGSIDFEIRTNTQNASLGCSSTVQCSVVVVPIEGLSCSSASQSQCNLTGAYAPGQYDQGTGSNIAVTANLWWSPSNWRNRFVFPLEMAPPPNVCTLASAGSPVPFYGSELLAQAALQWTPAYCLNKKRFNWQDNVMPDDAAYTLMQSGEAAAALVTDARAGAGVGYAPTAVSGWGIAFDIDKPDGSQLDQLNLNARLLAKLLTESYPGSSTGAARPGLENNPYSLNLDPEFQALNPGLDQRHFSEAAATLLALSIPDDVMSSVTSYIASDKDAMAFINGQPDSWGMKVNPAYKGTKLPADHWPLQDTWAPTNTGSQCLNANTAPYLQKIASPLSSLRLIATAMLYNWPNVSTVCGFDAATNTYTLGRTTQQGIGSRFMLGLVTLGDAHRYGLTVANLEGAPNSFVAPTNAGMAAAVKLAKQPKVAGSGLSATDRAEQPFAIAAASLRKSATAYPGTMIISTAAKTSGLPKATAEDVASFIKISSTEGQHQGRANGQLPDGYLPITNSGATKPLFQMAQRVAASVLAQRKPKAPSTPGAGATTAPAAPTPTVPVVPPATGVTAGTPPTTASTPAAADTVSAPIIKTAAVTSSLGGNLLPTLLCVGLIGLLMGAASRLWLRMKGLR